jgi:glycosyltransferase involved in cell wall biosynthesis
MKILHVCESLVGGPASYLEEILPYQMQQFGADNVSLLAPADHHGFVPPSIGCRIETYARTGRNLRSILALAWAIRKNIQRKEPDIVHLHSSLAGAVGRLTVPRDRRRPRIVYCAHGWAFDRPRRTIATRLFSLIERLLSRLADAIIIISPHEAPLLHDAGIPLANTKLVVSGIKDLPPSSDAAPSVPHSGRPLRLLFVGRLDLQKGVDLLLREFALLEPGRATLTLVGAKIVDKRDLTIPADVELLGWAPRESLPALFRQFDAVVMPSRWEGMPLLAIEALRSGLPLVCSSHGAFPHFIEDGINGFLVDFNIPHALDRVLKAFEAADRPTMRTAARATFMTMFQQSRMNSDLVDLYDSLIETPPKSTVASSGRPLGSFPPAPATGQHPLREPAP